VVRHVQLASLLLMLLGWLTAPVLGATSDDLYDQLITTAAQRHGLEPTLVKAVIKCESDFNARAQSPRGAQGLMQLIPSTQALLGVSDPFDPQENVSGGTHYLALLKQMFSGDLRLTLAAYNAGPQRVIDAGYTIPAISETQQYVRCVQSSYERYSQPGMLPALALASPPISPETEQRYPLKSSAPRLTYIPPGATRQALVVQPLRLSSQVAQLGQQITVYLEAINTSQRLAQGVVMLHYPEHAVSFIGLQADGQGHPAQLAMSRTGSITPAASTASMYQLLWSRWSSWAPGEHRTAVVTVVPRVPQDITLHVSVMLEQVTTPAASQQWSMTVRIPLQTVALAHDNAAWSRPRQ
jgi:Transglycosylase SLT domain